MQTCLRATPDKWASVTGPPEGAARDLRQRTDDDLLRLCQRGEQAALEELVQRYQKPLFRFLARMMGSVDDAEDATLDVFVRAWQHAPRFQFRSSVATWLYRIASNIARDLHRRKTAYPQVPWDDARELDLQTVESAETDALDRVERQQRAGSLERALRRLNENDRLLIVLYYMEERSYEDIQAITGVSYTVLKTRLTRARQRLRAMLDADAQEADR